MAVGNSGLLVSTEGKGAGEGTSPEDEGAEKELVVKGELKEELSAFPEKEELLLPEGKGV